MTSRAKCENHILRYLILISWCIHRKKRFCQSLRPFQLSVKLRLLGHTDCDLKAVGMIVWQEEIDQTVRPIAPSLRLKFPDLKWNVIAHPGLRIVA
jgi:hypothetical protein